MNAIAARDARAWTLIGLVVMAALAGACGEEVSRDDPDAFVITGDTSGDQADLSGDLDNLDAGDDVRAEDSAGADSGGGGDSGAEDARAGDSGQGDAGGGGDSGADGGDDAGVDADVAAADVVQPGSIAIFLAGDATERVFDDGLSGQTPRDYVIALSRYELLTSASDESPVLCFEHGDEPAEADMSGDNFMGRCATSAIPTASYTHGRVKVEWVRLTVDGRVHAEAGTFPGEFEVFRAYSDTRYGGRTWRASQGYVEYRGVVTFRVETTFSTENDAPTHVLDDGEYLLTFPYGRALAVVRDGPDAYWARFNWQTFEGFRWRDEEREGFRGGAWDVVAETPRDSETVLYQGVTGYYVTTSED